MNQELLPPQAHGAAMVPMGETAGTAAAMQARSKIEARYAMAIRNPRDLDTVRQRFLKECQRPSFAGVALYKKPIGGDKFLTGPSIRFAETMIRCMTNIAIDCMTVYDDREKRIVHVSVTDMESNVPYEKDVTIQKTVERKNPRRGDVIIRTRLNSYGDEVSLIEAGDDEVTTKEAALISKTIRTLGLRLAPGDLIDEGIREVAATQAREDAKDPDATKRLLFDAFLVLGVTAEQLKEYLGHDARVLQPKEATDLRAMYSAIRDGEATLADFMDKKAADAGSGKTPAGAAELEAKLRAQREQGGAAGAQPAAAASPEATAARAAPSPTDSTTTAADAAQPGADDMFRAE